MKHLRWIASTALLAGLFSGAVSAQQDSAPVPNPVSSTVKAQLTRYAKNMVAAADSMPAEKYSFKPTPEMITFAHLVSHIAQSNNFLCSKISGAAAPDGEEPHQLLHVAGLAQLQRIEDHRIAA